MRRRRRRRIVAHQPHFLRHPLYLVRYQTATFHTEAIFYTLSHIRRRRRRRRASPQKIPHPPPKRSGPAKPAKPAMCPLHFDETIPKPIRSDWWSRTVPPGAESMLLRI